MASEAYQNIPEVAREFLIMNPMLIRPPSPSAAVGLGVALAILLYTCQAGLLYRRYKHGGVEKDEF